MYIIQEKLYFQEIDYVNKNVKGIIYENVKGEDTNAGNDSMIIRYTIDHSNPGGAWYDRISH
jgi:hypothetical protein